MTKVEVNVAFMEFTQRRRLNVVEVSWVAVTAAAAARIDSGDSIKFSSRLILFSRLASMQISLPSLASDNKMIAFRERERRGTLTDSNERNF